MIIEIIITAILLCLAAYILYKNIRKKSRGSSCCSSGSSNCSDCSTCSYCNIKRDGK